MLTSITDSHKYHLYNICKIRILLSYSESEQFRIQNFHLFAKKFTFANVKNNCKRSSFIFCSRSFSIKNRIEEGFFFLEHYRYLCVGRDAGSVAGWGEEAWPGGGAVEGEGGQGRATAPGGPTAHQGISKGRQKSSASITFLISRIRTGILLIIIVLQKIPFWGFLAVSWGPDAD